MKTSGLNSWITPTGVAHDVPMQEHHIRARGFVESDLDLEPSELFSRLYDRGWARVQWESPKRLNVAFRTAVGANALSEIIGIVESWISKGGSVYAISDVSDAWIQSGSRGWRHQLKRLAGRQ